MTSTRKHKKAHAADSAPTERQEDTQDVRAGTAHNGQEHGLHMHTLHADLPIPYLTPGDLIADAKAARAATSKLPSIPGMPPPRRLAFYGGLGALVVTGLVDLPVAVAIGAATIVARGKGEERQAREEQQDAPQTERTARPEPSGRTEASTPAGQTA